MPEFEIALRWVHFAAGITWIGLLYFFNFVNVPFQKELDADVKPKVNPKLLGRALWWFRHAAWITVLVGLGLLWQLYWQYGNFVDTDGAKTILVGALLGVIMLLNVWGVIWPNQKKALAAMAAGQKADPNWAKMALYASRTNVVLSFPMLFFMAGATHYPLGWPGIGATFLVLGAVAWGLVWWVQMRPAGSPAVPKPAAAGPTK